MIPENKKVHLQYEPILVDVFNPSGEFKIENVIFENNEFMYIS